MRSLVPATAPRHRSTQQPNVSKYARSVSNGFLCALEACLVNWELPKLKLFICSDVLGELRLSRKSQMAFSSHRKVLGTLNMGPVESLRTSSSFAFIRKL